MSKKNFTNKEIEILSNNKYVKNVSAKGVTYTEEFRNIFIIEHDKGKLPRIIFTECGFDINIIGMYRISSAAKRWKKAYKENGVIGLNDTRKLNSGRPTKKELSIEAKYERLQAQINLLKAENELLKKIQFLERGLIKNK